MIRIQITNGLSTENFVVSAEQMKDIKECLEGMKNYVVLERDEQEVVLPGNYLKSSLISVSSEAKEFFF